MARNAFVLIVALALCLSAGQAQCEEILDLRVFDADVEIIGTDGDRLGIVVAAGDINGDGIDDIVAAEEWGSVYVVYGDTALAGIFDIGAGDADVTIQGIGVCPSTYSSPNACFADLDGDAVEDLIILSMLGHAVLVIYGDVSLPSVIAGGESLPFPVGNTTAVGAGDFDQDGSDDPMMATFWSAEDGVQVFAMSGQSAPADQVNRLTTFWDVHIKVTDCGSLSCPSVCPTDINSDGFDDIIFSSMKYYGPAYPDYAGGVWAIYGAAVLPEYVNLDSAEADLSIYGEGGYFGAGTGSGDVNGDGFTDLIIGAPMAFHPYGGMAYVLYGDTLMPDVINLADTVAGVNIYGPDTSKLGNVIAAGDFNGDGCDDMLFGGRQIGGRAYLVFGDQSLSGAIHVTSDFHGITIIGEEQDGYELIGSDVSMGDFNGDGLSDLLIGASGYHLETPGMAYVIFGTNTVNYGDVNYDRIIDMGDAVFLLNYLFKSGPQPYPKLAGDTNCDEVVDVADVVYLLNYLFKNGSEPGCS